MKWEDNDIETMSLLISYDQIRSIEEAETVNALPIFRMG